MNKNKAPHIEQGPFLGTALILLMQPAVCACLAVLAFFKGDALSVILTPVFIGFFASTAICWLITIVTPFRKKFPINLYIMAVGIMAVLIKAIAFDNDQTTLMQYLLFFILGVLSEYAIWKIQRWLFRRYHIRFR